MSIKVWIVGEEVHYNHLNTNFEETRQGLPIYAADAGSTDTYAVTFTPAITSLNDGLCVRFKANTTNAGDCSMNPNGLGAVPIRKHKTQKLGNGDITAGRIVSLIYDATQAVWQLDSPPLEPQTGYTFFSTFPSPAVNDAGLPPAFSDASTKLYTFPMWANGASTRMSFGCWLQALDYGVMPYPQENVVVTRGAGNFGTAQGAIKIGSDYFFSYSTNSYNKNGSDMSLSGTGRAGPLGHDPTLGYLLQLYSTTKIARFSGISGTTLTAQSDITLSNAVTAGIGFFFDNTNSRYICVDTTNNVIRRFDSSGTQIDTVAYTIDDQYVVGCVPINGRVFLLVRPQWYVGAPYINLVYAVPTTMVL